MKRFLLSNRSLAAVRRSAATQDTVSTPNATATRPRGISTPAKKHMAIMGLAAALAGTALGQGTVISANNSNSRITNVLTSAPVPAGTTFQVALYYLPDTGVPPSLWGGIWGPNPGWIMLGAAVNIGPAAGLYQIGTRTTPSTTPPGGAAWFQVRVWEAAFGTTFDEAWNNPILIGGRGMVGFISNVMNVTTGDPTTTPMGIPGRANPIGFIPLIPEPSVAALVLAGAVTALLAAGRKARTVASPPC